MFALVSMKKKKIVNVIIFTLVMPISAAIKEHFYWIIVQQLNDKHRSLIVNGHDLLGRICMLLSVGSSNK